MNNNCFLVTRSRHDPGMHYLFYWAGKVIEEANKKNFQILDLSEEKANQKDFNGRMKKLRPGLLFLNGHGDSDKVTGHNDQILIKVGQNDELIRDCIVYALSCRSAAELGKTCVSKGTISYIGYNDVFVFLYEEDKTTHPLEDKTASLFLGPSNLIISSLLKGNLTGQAVRKSQEEFKRNIRKLITSESPQEDKSPIPWLIWDMEHQVCLGDQAAKI